MGRLKNNFNKNFKRLFGKRKKYLTHFKDDEIYLCSVCGYHQGVAWFGKMLRCRGCGSFKWKKIRNDPFYNNSEHRERIKSARKFFNDLP